MIIPVNILDPHYGWKNIRSAESCLDPPFWRPKPEKKHCFDTFLKWMCGFRTLQNTVNYSVSVLRRFLWEQCPQNKTTQITIFWKQRCKKKTQTRTSVVESPREKKTHCELQFLLVEGIRTPVFTRCLQCQEKVEGKKCCKSHNILATFAETLVLTLLYDCDGAQEPINHSMREHVWTYLFVLLKDKNAGIYMLWTCLFSWFFLIGAIHTFFSFNKKQSRLK